MKNILYIFLCISLTFSSCTNNFEEINTNPNASENIDPQYLLSNVLSVAADRNTYEQGFRLSNYLTQFSASVEFERIDRYEMGSNSEYWKTIYQLLTDINSMQTVNGTNDFYVAVGDIMKAYLFSQLTDMWGDVPYSEALKAKEGITQPKYDRQEFIYTDSEQGILAKLTDAANVITASSSSIQGDIMFAGDKLKWIKFAKALQVRYYLRISNRITDFSGLQALVAGQDIMTGNEDNAVVPYLSAAPNQFPMSQASQGLYQEHRMTQTVDSVLSSWNDPRVAALYKPSAASVSAGDPQFNGLLNGQSRETISASNVDLNDISLFGTIYRDIPNGVDGQFMQYAELQFALAEAVERGFITGDAKTYYENGVQAHFDYLNVEMPADYLTAEHTSYTGNVLEKILYQKWISLISNGHEAWFNVRRTGVPNLKPGPDNLNADRYPTRYLYPESEQATNVDNYNAAVSNMGADDINTKVWWEK